MADETGMALLGNLQDRLLAGLLGGPALNCRPHGSRQRVDWMSLARMEDLAPADALRQLLGETGACKFTARVPAVPGGGKGEREGGGRESDDPAQQRWLDQAGVMGKLRSIAEDAATYAQDTGVHVLSVGYPLLRLPSGQAGGRRRILAPVAFIPVSITLKGAVTKSVEIRRAGDGADLVQPNAAALAWLEQMKLAAGMALDPDAGGENPWGEIAAAVREVCKALQLAVPALFAGETLPAAVPLQAAPRAEGEETAGIVDAAVIGLFPMANEGLIRDMRALTAGERLAGPIESFVRAGMALADGPATEGSRGRLVSQADPCQSRAVRLARHCRGLVIHGPPGTGKSQTITNIIGDHLSRGERVLFVSDKRTALDVVYIRLAHLGLGHLCAVVHDPKRDQRELYKSVRAQLDGLPDQRTRADAEGKLGKAEGEIAALHGELEAYRSAVMDAPGVGSTSLHELVGRWLDLPEPTLACETPDAMMGDFEAQEMALGELIRRAHGAGYPVNPWREATGGMGLDAFMRLSPPEVRRAMEAAESAAAALDATCHELIPAFAAATPVAEQAAARQELLTRLTSALTAPAEIRAHWAVRDSGAIGRGLQQLEQAKPLLGKLRGGPLDAELGAAARGHMPAIAAIGQQTAALDDYLAVCRKWYGCLALKKKRAAAAVITPYGVAVSAEHAERVRAFLQDLRGRLVLSQLHHDLATGEPAPAAALVPDDQLDRSMAGHAEVLSLMAWVEGQKALQPLAQTVRRALVNAEAAQQLNQGLALSAGRAEGLIRAQAALAGVAPISAAWRVQREEHALRGDPIATAVSELRAHLPELEDVVRVQAALGALRPALAGAVAALVERAVDPGLAMDYLRRATLAAEISRRLAASPHLHAADDRRLREAFDRHRALSAECRGLARDAIVHLWTQRQRTRLLAATGTRLSGMGAEVRRRFMLQGEKAMRLRRVIEVGRGAEGGDPLFDLRPVWMASPETVAQLFPREPLFDLVVFDEASQCRLEEAIPVLTRAQRVVVAGDPRQLPPSRFFEAAAVASEEREAETDQELFESQQADTEDLLSAALNLEIQESYLDVHYRSRNADLIGFSNEHFYGRRLQAIPAHPKHRVKYAPLSLHHVGGTYASSLNEEEATAVCRIVHDLLRRAEPPSIGIACFNVDQRDLILEKLDELAEVDGEFGRRLDAARRREGQGAFEGLFVKNLENVQGDERDHIIISTTYGPDAAGRFYRRFGPLGRAGGGRRLNVLVTRARDEVHLVTSIPREAYRALPPIPEGQVPTGGWLLFAYLKYAEDLGGLYAAATAAEGAAESAARGGGAPGGTLASSVDIRPADPPSGLAGALARRLAGAAGASSTVHWGNDGFAVDIAVAHPHRPGDMALGVLADFTRYLATDDPVEWDIFRTAVHESQGWALRRVWSPHVFRDPEAHVAAIAAAAAAAVAAEPPEDGIAVAPARPG